MVFAIANQEMAIFGPLDSGAMRRLNYEVSFRHAGVKRHPCYGPGLTWVGVADNIDLEISTLPYPLQELPALAVVTSLTEPNWFQAKKLDVWSVPTRKRRMA